jgi:hypothetical protein
VNDFHDKIKAERGWRFRLMVWYYSHIGHPRDQRKWDKAVKVIRDWDFYVISDYQYFRGVEAGLWDIEQDAQAHD